jgi:Ca-activated chloride channel family protein
MRFLALPLALLVIVPAAAQQTVFRAGTQTVPIYATVLDANGRLVTDLEREHFDILDDGKRQQITVFKSDIQPISVIVLLDTSGSMTFLLDLLKQAAEQFVIRLLPADRARIGSFAATTRIRPDTFTSNRDDLIRVLHTDIQFGNATHLWDAISIGLDALAGQEGRRVLLVFTDGEDDKSENVKFAALFARAQKDDIMIYGIGLHGNVLGRSTRPDEKLRDLALETGGGFFELQGSKDLASTFTRVADELHRQYILGFSPSVFDDRPHLLDVRVKVDGMKARARKSYVATRVQ